MTVSLPNGAIVFRMTASVLSHCLPHTDLIPNSTDKSKAATCGLPVRVTVWDSARTSEGEASALRPGTQAFSFFYLNVSAIGDLQAAYGWLDLDAVEDPNEADAGKPGANGHCGLEGLERKPGEPRRDYHTRLGRLANKFWRRKPDRVGLPT